MLEVATKRPKSVTCRHAKVAFAAARSVGVGPGVKMDWNRSVRKADITMSFSSPVLYILTEMRGRKSVEDVVVVLSLFSSEVGSWRGWKHLVCKG